MVNPKLLVFILFLLAGCGQKSNDDYLEIGNRHLQNNNLPEAVIAFKNGIQNSPTNYDLRLALGSAYLSIGQSLPALKELEKALELTQIPSSDLLGKLARALYLSNNFVRLIQLQESSPEENLPHEFHYFVGLSYQMLGDPQLGLGELRYLSGLSPASVVSNIALAYLKLSDGKTDEALSILENESLADSAEPELFWLKTQLFLSNNDYEKAAYSIQKYLDIYPNELRGVTLALHISLVQEKYDDVRRLSDALISMKPSSGFANFVKALLKFNTGDFKSAKVLADKSIGNQYDNVPSRLLLTYINFALTDFEQSYNNYLKIDSQLQDDHPSKKLKGVLQIALGYQEKAIKTFSNSVNLEPKDLNFLNQTAIQLFRNEQVSDAKSFVELTSSFQHNNLESTILQTHAGLLVNNQSAQKMLDDILESNPNSLFARLSKIDLLVEQGQLSEAMRLLKEWKKSYISPPLLLAEAYIHFSQNQVESAEILIEKVIELEPENIPANLYNVGKLIDQGEIEQSIKKLSEILNLKPNNLRALSLLNETCLRSRDLACFKKYINFWAAQKLGDQGKKNLLTSQIDRLLNKGELNLALDVLAEYSSLKVPESIWELTYQLRIKLNELLKNETEAFRLASQWLEKSPTSEKAFFNVISLSIKQEKFADCASLSRARNKSYRDRDLVELLGAYCLGMSNDKESALLRLDNFKTNDARLSALRFELMSNIFLSKNDYANAFDTFENSFSLSPSVSVSKNWIKSALLINKVDRVVAALERNEEITDRDIELRLFIANYYLDKNIDKSGEYYESILESDPKHIYSLNNLAWIKMKQSFLEDSQKLIDKAIELEANNTVILRTAAEIYDSLGKEERASYYRKRANSTKGGS